MSQAKVLTVEVVGPFTIHLAPVIQMDNDQFFEFCQLNRDLQFERTAEGDIVVMSPAGGYTSRRNSKLIRILEDWAIKDGTGLVFDSSGGFNLPNGATRAPDVAWVKRSRLATLTPEQKEKFIPLCPDFVIELRSPSDRLQVTQDKMVEYVTNGLQLGWLIDPQEQRVHVYDSSGLKEILEQPQTISGEPILAGFSLELDDIWTVDF